MPAGFWDYFDAIPAVDFQGYAFGQGDIVAHIEIPLDLSTHVLLCSNVRDVFLVIVIDLSVRDMLGHHLLDLPMLGMLSCVLSSEPSAARVLTIGTSEHRSVRLGQGHLSAVGDRERSAVAPLVG